MARVALGGASLAGNAAALPPPGSVDFRSALRRASCLRASRTTSAKPLLASTDRCIELIDELRLSVWVVAASRERAVFAADTEPDMERAVLLDCTPLDGS